MSILTRDDYIAAKKQRVVLNKTASITGVAAKMSQVIQVAGNPGAGTLAGTSATTGVVPTDATSGCPIINAFDAGAKGYLTRVEAWSNVAADITIYDILWKGGAYAFNANVSAQTPASYASRVPGGTDFKGLELWAEAVTAFTLVPGFTVAYLDQDGNAGSTGLVAADNALIVGRMVQLPLATDDCGIQGVTGVTCGTASAGTFNLLVLRPLLTLRVPVANGQAGPLDLMRTGMPEVFAHSALIALPTPDSTATPLSWVALEIASK